MENFTLRQSALALPAFEVAEFLNHISQHARSAYTASDLLLIEHGYAYARLVLARHDMRELELGVL